MTSYTILPVNVPKRKMDEFWFIRKRKFSNSSVINEFYFEEESKKGRFYWADLQVKWYYSMSSLRSLLREIFVIPR